MATNNPVRGPCESTGIDHELVRIGTPPPPALRSFSWVDLSTSHCMNRKVGSGFLLAALMTTADGSASAARVASWPALVGIGP